jgi:cobalt-zinc-cadmium efflux system protein
LVGTPRHAHARGGQQGGPAGEGAPATRHDAGHDHDHDHDHGSSARGQGHDHAHHAHQLRGTPLRRLTWAFGITASFMLVEAGVGWWSGSLALLADAGHMLADAAALLLAILAQRIASQKRTRAQTYGYRRAEVLAAFANGVALALTAIWIFKEAVERWQHPPAVHAAAMTATAVVGLAVNLGSAAMLATGAGHNANTRAALAHVLSDAVGSVGAIVAGVIILATGWTRADPVISAVIGVLVLWGGYRLVTETSRVLMEGSPTAIDIAVVEETIRGVPGVYDMHDLHVWSISDGFDVLTVHVVIDRGHHGIDVVDAVARRLRDRHQLDHVTIQPETRHDDRLVKIGLRRPEPTDPEASKPPESSPRADPARDS